MSKFAEVIKQETPRLVVMFRRTPQGAEEFIWGMQYLPKYVPILTLIGYISRVQESLRKPTKPDSCPESALVIAYVDNALCYFVHPDIPTDPLIGMLETIKSALVKTTLAQQHANQQIILGPDGNPVRR